MQTYRLTVEFEGTRYRGWQEQKNARTVAGELRSAIESEIGERVELGGAGRTDAGVHALAQVAHLRLARAVEPQTLRRAVNEKLPADIHLLALVPAPERFHARHHAQARSYLYQISRRRTALAKRYVWWIKRPLAVEAMVVGAAQLAGGHDFAAFCEQPEAQESTLVVVESAQVTEAEALILVRVVASHFLWKMVRRLVGGLVRLGSGELSPREWEQLLAGGEPGADSLPAEWTAPPSGLFLERVLYPGEPPLGPLRPVTPIEPEAAELRESGWPDRSRTRHGRHPGSRARR